MRIISINSFAAFVFLLVIAPGLGFLFRLKPNAKGVTKTSMVNNEYNESLEKLRQAIATKDTDRRVVVESISTLEKLSKNAVDPKTVEGTWEVVFSSIPGGADKGFLIGGFFNGYFAIKEVCNFYEFSLKSSFGGFRGPSRIASKSPLVIEYENKEFKFGLFGTEVPPMVRSYKFIYADDNIAVARSSFGAGTLFSKVAR